MTEHPAPYAISLHFGDPYDRRCPDGLPTRQALVRLRLAEFRSADHLPQDLMQELTAAIDGVVAIVRGRS